MRREILVSYLSSLVKLGLFIEKYAFSQYLMLNLIDEI